MGLQAEIDAGVADVFEAMGDLVVVMPLQAASTLDPVTEIDVPGVTGTVKVIQLSQADAEKSFTGVAAGDIQASDVQLMALAASATLTPTQDQEATWRGKSYNIHAVDDTQQALLLLSLRAPI